MSSEDELRNDISILIDSRRSLLDAVFAKYEREDKLCQTSFSVDELSDDYEEECLFSNNVNQDNLTEDEKLLVNKVEYDLKSNLKGLILQREKIKLIMDRNGYKKIHPEVKDEIKRLMQDLSEPDIKKYIGLCVVSNEQTKHFIEEVIHSNFKELLLNLLEAASNKIFSKMCKRVLLEEWSYLSKFLTEEDIVVYAIKVVTKQY